MSGNVTLHNLFWTSLKSRAKATNAVSDLPVTPNSADLLERVSQLKGLDGWTLKVPFDDLTPTVTVEFAEVAVLLKQACIDASVYVVARDHGLNAGMLYKVSDGNIDPRQR